jgi:hypothetical protein
MQQAALVHYTIALSEPLWSPVESHATDTAVEMLILGSVSVEVLIRHPDQYVTVNL